MVNEQIGASGKDPFTELAMDSIMAAREKSEMDIMNHQPLFPETPIHMNSTAVGTNNYQRIESINATPIHNPLKNITNHGMTFYEKNFQIILLSL